MMIHTSESDVTSLGASSAGSSPKPTSGTQQRQPVYYVQSPSRDSHEEDNKSSTSAGGPTQTNSSTFRSPSSETQSLLSLFGRQSRPSSAGSRVSGGGFRRNKGRRERESRRLLGHVREEGEEGGKEREFYVKWWKDEDGEELSRSCKVLLGVVVLGILFFVGCFVVWGASRPFSAHVLLKDMTVNDIYYGEGSDQTGVPTKILTIKCTVKMRVHNPATFFGIYVSSSSITLRYFDLTIASGQMERYYQPRKSWRTVGVKIQGREVPLYGAALGLVDMEKNKLSDGEVPLILEFEMSSHGDVLGKLVRANHHQHIRCSLIISSHFSHLHNFTGHSCMYK